MKTASVLGARKPVIALLAFVVLVGGACGGSAAKSVVLDGRPRRADDEGIVRSVSFDSLVLDTGHRYRVTKQLQSFSSQTMQPVPLLQRQGQYVQVGTSRGRLVWIAAIGSPLGQPPTVSYPGKTVRGRAGEVVFADGTVLRTRAGVHAPPPGSFTIAEVDVASRRVRSFTTP